MKTAISKRIQSFKEEYKKLPEKIAHRLWQTRTGGNKPQVSPEEAERLAALQDWQTGERIAANPIRLVIWWGGEQLKALNRSKAPTIKFIRFFVWEIPKWNITALKLFLQSDIVKILAVPVVAAIITTATTINERREREQVETFDEYLNQIDTLTFEHGLLTEEPSPGAVVLARGRTVATLRKLDLKRRQELIAFIQASGLHKGEDAVISFEGANLQGIDLREADLRGFTFEAVDLSEADLSAANLSWSNLTKANLNTANLSEGYLEASELSRADLKEADLSGASLRRASLSDANLSEANLSSANLSEANLSGADLRLANLSDANLSEANLSGADLRSANLSRANLIQADFSKANLRFSDLFEATIFLPDFFGFEVNLEGADLTDSTWIDNSKCNSANCDGRAY
ncbi:MAG: pentapeptide repeat-containing protein [Spirulinaceae cyanobacterium]